MKKFMMTAISLLLAFTLAACGSKTGSASESGNESNGSSSSAGMANPWTDVETPEEAADGAGVGYFIVPESGTETSGGPIYWDAFRYMTGLAEAQGGIGAADFTARKGLKQDSTDVSGDYNEYKYSWKVEAEDFTADCWGNEEGKTMKAVWLSDNFSYSFTVRGQGDIHDTYGIDNDAVVQLVNTIQ